MISDTHLAFLIEERGIREDTANAFGLYSDGNTLVLPHKTGEKRRWFKKSGERGFSFTEGAKPWLYGKDWEDKDVLFLVEGETDTLRLWQELRDEESDAGVAGIPGVNTYKSVWARAITAKRVYIILDNDPAYAVRDVVEKLRAQLAVDLGPDRVVQVRLPDDVKDLCEFFEGYDLDYLRETVGAVEHGQYHYNSLDLTIAPKPYDWLIKGLLCANDIALLTGSPGIGKSLLAMDLCIKVAGGEKRWLEMELLRQGRVLIVDEENQRDVVYNRLHALGATPEAMQNIRYLWKQGIKLDKGRHAKLLDEIKLWQPQVILLDSLKRFHRLDENSASDMSHLFEDGIWPLSQVCGSTVLVLHHTTKGDQGDSIQKARGSGDITAAPDTGLEIRKANSGGGRLLRHFKGRRGQSQEATFFVISGDEDNIEIKEGREF